LEADTGIYASNFPHLKKEERKIMMRTDDWGREIGLFLSVKPSRIWTTVAAIYVRSEDFPKLILKMIEFYVNISNTREAAKLLTEINNLYINQILKKMKRNE